MNLAIWLHRTGLLRPDQPAIRFGTDLHATYAQFAFRSWAIGRHLASSHGIGPGSRVALFAGNCPEYLEVLYGVLWVGAAIVPINYKLHPRETAWIVENSEAALLISDTGETLDKNTDAARNCREIAIGSLEMKDAISNASREEYVEPTVIDDDDLAWLFYTSGTTGRPKGVMTSHRNLRMMATSYAMDVDPVSHDRHSLYAAPLSHGAGLYNFQFVRAGACHVIPVSKRFDPAEIASLAGSLGNLVFFAAPTMVVRLVKHAMASGYRGDGIRTIVYGGGPMYVADIIEALDLFGPKFVQIYGQGESPMTISVLPRDFLADTGHPKAEKRLASVGFAQSCVEVRVVDRQGDDAPVGEVGEVVVRGDTVMTGYWRNEAAFAETVVDGWLRTGDLGAMDEDGLLTLTDRSKDVVISGGTNIYPREVEEAILTHDGVLEVSVIGCPHPDWGEEVVAFLVMRNGTTFDKDALDTWCKTQIASFKKPKRYVVVPELPKNSYGKILKTELREQAACVEKEHSAIV